MRKHNLAVYFNKEYGRLHVVHEFKGDTVVIGGACHYWSDAYTNNSRYEVPTSLLNSWQRVIKRKLDSYSFLTKKYKKSHKDVKVKDEISKPLDGLYFHDHPEIIRRWNQRTYY